MVKLCDIIEDVLTSNPDQPYLRPFKSQINNNGI